MKIVISILVAMMLAALAYLGFRVITEGSTMQIVMGWFLELLVVIGIILGIVTLTED